MRPDVFSEYDRTRDFTSKSLRAACYAPFTALYFFPDGNVRVCCYNSSHLVGNLSETTIAGIWKGEKIKALRRALADYDFSSGCKFCALQLADGCHNALYARHYDRFPVSSAEPAWPLRMDFSLTNTCNLECIMCQGARSSSIRARREKRQPLPKIYGESFFAELRTYLPHLAHARFLGGEPFLSSECFRIWNMMVADDLSIHSEIVTNGSQYNSRVEQVLDRLRLDISVSLDGASKDVIEGIRKNIRYENLLENCQRFRDYCRAKRTTFCITFCLMQQNWHEFGKVCLLADEWNCPVSVNTVLWPSHCALYTLPTAELTTVVNALREEAASLLPKLRKNRAVWTREVERLSGRAGYACDLAAETARR
jgi:MoaA/NifB/PqqE/SkfB family radical SAM enzyme